LFSSSGQADVVDQFIINRINVIQERSLAKFLGSLWLPFLYAFVSTVLFCSVLIAFAVVLCSGFTQVGKVSLEVI